MTETPSTKEQIYGMRVRYWRQVFAEYALNGQSIQIAYAVGKGGKETIQELSGTCKYVYQFKKPTELSSIIIVGYPIPLYVIRQLSFVVNGENVTYNSD